MLRFLRQAAIAALAGLILDLAGCSGEKPAAPVSADKADALKQEADQQRQANDRMRHNK